MNIETFFTHPSHNIHRRYEALRAFFVEERKAEEVAGRYGYTVASLYSLIRDFKRLIKRGEEVGAQSFFVSPHVGRKRRADSDKLTKLIIGLRKNYLSVPDIKAIVDSQDYDVSEKYIYNVIHREGFARLPRRTRVQRREAHSAIKVKAQRSELLTCHEEEFQTEYGGGLFCLLPYIEHYGIARLIESSLYPGTKTIPTLNAILSVVALKASSIRRYTADDLWCMDRGLGLLAGLNVLPKAAWYTSYSHRITRKMNRAFLADLHALMVNKNLLSDTSNLDFTTVPYWGNDNSHLENNWSGTRHKALASMLTILAHDPDSGIITYGDTTVRHKNQAKVVVEFLDFYRNGGGKIDYLVFDSKFTTYENLTKLDEKSIKFLTIRRRGSNIVKRIDAIPMAQRKKIRVPSSNGKKRLLYILDEIVFLKDYGKEIRQVAISGHGKIKPALIITNDFELPVEEIVLKYARRWIIEKEISQQIEFFHLNKLSSSMVIKVDFDFTMTILTHNLFRLFALNLLGYEKCSPRKLFEQFLHNGADIQVSKNKISIALKKKRSLPALLTTMEPFQGKKIPWLNNRHIAFSGASRC